MMFDLVVSNLNRTARNCYYWYEGTGSGIQLNENDIVFENKVYFNKLIEYLRKSKLLVLIQTTYLIGMFASFSQHTVS